MTRYFDIGRDEIVLHLREGKYITGFTTAGAYDTDFGQVKVNREILPAYFFDNFACERYLYYKKPEEVIENKDYVPPRSNDNDEESQQLTVPKEQYDSLKAELEIMRQQQEAMMKMLQQLLGQKG
ncbi:hypothetical protein [Staphylococcus phage pSco-10]|nr:hypothetical protein [Staphylococcus phage pSco-10]